MKKVLIIATSFILLAKIFDTFCFHTLKYFNSHTFIGQDGGDINKYLKDDNPPELVIMGSSTTRFQVNPDSFSLKSCNLSRAMTTDCYQLGLLSLMIQHNKIPKNILLSLWPRNYLMFNEKDQHPEDILFLKYYYDESDHIKKEIDDISYFEKYKFLFSSYRFNGMVTNILKYYYLGRQSNGKKYYFKYQASTINDSINVSNIKKLKSNNSKRKSLALANLQTIYLSRFIDTCAKYNINLMCYYMPMLDEDTILIKHGEGFMDNVTANKKIPLFKFTNENVPVIFNHPDYWVDGEHMNEKGGKVQSSILAAFVQQHLKKSNN